MSFIKQLKVWLEQQGATVEHEVEELVQHEMDHLRGLWTHRHGIPAATIADILVHPTLLPAELYAEITGQEVPDYADRAAAEAQAKKNKAEADQQRAAEEAETQRLVDEQAAADKKAEEAKRAEDEAAAVKDGEVRAAAEEAARLASAEQTAAEGSTAETPKAE